MIGDPWPEEPDEPLVERFDRDEPPGPDPPSPEAVPADVRRAFWSVVGGVNVGLLAGSLGVMLVWFRAEWATGGGLVALAIAALLWSYYRYRRFEASERSE